MLDMPFLFIFVAIMFYYSVSLTLIVLGILAVIVAMSLLVAPVFQARLNQQFLLGARNQAFVTEYVAGLETVKSLQMEPQLKSRYGDRLVFWGGGVDTQKTLPFGTPQEVRDEVRERIEIFAPGGGFVFSTIHNIQANTPIGNVLAMFEVVKEYR